MLLGINVYVFLSAASFYESLKLKQRQEEMARNKLNQNQQGDSSSQGIGRMMENQTTSHTTSINIPRFHNNQQNHPHVDYTYNNMPRHNYVR